MHLTVCLSFRCPIIDIGTPAGYLAADLYLRRLEL